MKVGVIIPAWNVLPWIEHLLETVWEQTWRGAGRRVSAYIADDHSDDGTYEFLCDRPSWYRGLTRTPVRLGWAGALNTAAGLAFGDGCDAVLTCSSDDFLRLDAVEACVGALRGETPFVIATSREVGGSNVVQRSQVGATLEDFGRWPPITDKALIPGWLWRAVGGYSEDVTPPGTFGSAEDWEFWIKVWKFFGAPRFSPPYRCTEDPVYYWRVHPGQLSHGRGAVHAAALDMIMRKHPDVPWAPGVKNWPPTAGGEEAAA